MHLCIPAAGLLQYVPRPCSPYAKPTLVVDSLIYVLSEPHDDASCGMKSCLFPAPGSGKPQGQSLYLICHCSPLGTECGTGVGVRLTGGMVWSKGSPTGGFPDYVATIDQQPPL